MTESRAEDGIQRLYAAAWVPMVRLATMLLGDQSRAEDVVQEAFIGLHRSWGRLDDEDRAAAYLRRSVVNGVRSAQRHQVVVDRQARAEQHDPSTAHTSPAADRGALEREQREILLRALDSLPLRQREVLTLRYWGELTEAEIADALGIRPGSVKSHAHRALAALAARREELR